MPPGPDHPTRPIPVAPPPRATDDEALIAELDHHLRSFRRMLVLVALLAVAALGVAIWSLIANRPQDVDPGPPAATQQQFQDLDERVSSLEGDLAQAPTNADIARLEDRRRTLAARVRDLSTRFEEAQASRVRPSAVEAVEEDLAALTERVDELERRLDEAAADTGADAGE